MSIKALLRPVYWSVLDILDRLSGKRDALTPPRRLIFVGDGDFKQVGQEFFGYFVNLCGLKPSSHVLDIGCGIGRMAIPMTTFMTSGRYEGIDIVPKGISWCTLKITKKYPNFQFRLADVHNKLYNPGGTYKASEFRFPYGEELFDFVFLTSVFTHMLPRDVENYTSEIVRVLKPNGTALVTHFLINEESLRLIDQGLGNFKFSDTGEGYWSVLGTQPEEAVGYDEASIRHLYGSHGMRLVEPIRYGSWCGRREFLSFQDIVIVRKLPG